MTRYNNNRHPYIKMSLDNTSGLTETTKIVFEELEKKYENYLIRTLGGVYIL